MSPCIPRLRIWIMFVVVIVYNVCFVITTSTVSASTECYCIIIISRGVVRADGRRNASRPCTITPFITAHSQIHTDLCPKGRHDNLNSNSYHLKIILKRTEVEYSCCFVLFAIKLYFFCAVNVGFKCGTVDNTRFVRTIAKNGVNYVD